MALLHHGLFYGSFARVLQLCMHATFIPVSFLAPNRVQSCSSKLGMVVGLKYPFISVSFACMHATNIGCVECGCK